MIATHEDSNGAGYCRGCGTTIGESHHDYCNMELCNLPNPVLALKRIFGELLRSAEREVQTLERDRDEWKEQHENLLAIHQQHLVRMQNKIEVLEGIIALTKDKPPAKPGRLMFGV